ncbi:MAG: hypothetical protein ACE363_13090 [Alphaproteobacteria bacterium]
MSAQKDLVRPHIEAILAEARQGNVPTDLVGRELLQQVIEIFRLERSNDDIASELTFTAENLDPDTEFTFMRP